MKTYDCMIFDKSKVNDRKYIRNARYMPAVEYYRKRDQIHKWLNDNIGSNKWYEHPGIFFCVCIYDLNDVLLLKLNFPDWIMGLREYNREVIR